MIECSFCGRNEEETHPILLGPSVAICEECVFKCKSVLEKMYEKELKNTCDAVLSGEDPDPEIQKVVNANFWRLL